MTVKNMEHYTEILWFCSDKQAKKISENPQWKKSRLKVFFASPDQSVSGIY